MCKVIYGGYIIILIAICKKQYFNITSEINVMKDIVPLDLIFNFERDSVLTCSFIAFEITGA